MRVPPTVPVQLPRTELALLYRSFGEFYQRGIFKCGLSVDAANSSGATRLYERAGMHPNNRTLIRSLSDNF